MSSRTSKQRIVLVDDNEMIRIVLRSLLRTAGYEVVGEARNGATGLEMVDRIRPDLVCLDVVMPVLNGIDTLLAIRDRFPAIPVLMITGQSDKDSIQSMICQGATDIIVKPFNSARVIETVARILGPGQQA
jgi:two-component system chemotaxis response regulator CheY